MTAHVAVVDASVGDTPARRNLRRELDTETTVFAASEGERPPVPASSRWTFDGVVVSGSQTAVYDDHDWIHELTEWGRRVHAAGVPALGVCWGHQFFAQALGGRVVDVGAYELGYQSVERVGDDPLFDGLSETFTAFETHSDRVAELPPGATTLARNSNGVQAYRVGRTYGVQFHPEYDRQTASWVIDGKQLPTERLEAARETITDETVAAAAETKQLFDNFRDLAVDHQPTATEVTPRTADGRR
ncbi:MAG: GMP synthase - glutamine amidotransferase domain protein [halophilic archaeon J07HB67]|nr:MAG: GMP synthase - glutamine amidotransferase domain protein [halophilic archaeon J07HB67]